MDIKKKILLHTCCAPCSIAIIDEMRADHGVTIFFYNPNIYPLAEYEKRKAEVVRVCREWRLPMIDRDRGADVWDSLVGGIRQDKEGGARCSACFRLRLTRAAICAKEGGFDAFATSLTSGRQKDSAVINAVGRMISEQIGVAFLDEDWKKGGRQEKARQMVAERGIYKQNYCGCRYSLESANGKARSADR
jgi:epoxyqueuosine reductase